MSTKHEEDLKDVQYSRELQLHLLSTGYWRSCYNCEYWGGNTYNPGTYGCEKADYQVPPLNVFLMGCPSWLQEIPF